MKTNVLIIGSKGMLGQELVHIFSADENYIVTAWDRGDVDVTDKVIFTEKINSLWPDIIINAVAYNAVDACEENDVEYALAKKLNVLYPEYLAKIAKTLNATIVHYSTDYVFDGERPIYKDGGRASTCCGKLCAGCMYMGSEESLSYYAYHEDDVPHPLSRYGQTKYDGEQIVAKNAGASFYIIRLSKLFGKPAGSDAGKKSFFDVMLAKGREAEKSGEDVRVVDGETSKFTYAPDLAQESKALVDSRAPMGIYHIANDGATTWYDGVRALYEIAGITANVVPVPSETFLRPAKRPSSSVLKMTKRESMRHYEEALTEYLNNDTI